MGQGITRTAQGTTPAAQDAPPAAQEAPTARHRETSETAENVTDAFQGAVCLSVLPFAFLALISGGGRDAVDLGTQACPEPTKRAGVKVGGK